MLSVTHAAGALLAQMLEEEQASEGVYVRFSFDSETTLNVQTCAPQTGDTAFCHEGRIVLVLDGKTADAMSEHMLDVEEFEDGLILVLEARSELTVREESV